LRSVLSLKKEEHIRNEVILKKLGTRMLLEIVLKRRFCYYGHISRYPGTTRWAQYLTTAELAGVPANKKGTKWAKHNWRKQLGSELQKASNTDEGFHKRTEETCLRGDVRELCGMKGFKAIFSDFAR
jgi:hypothetical protein